jgi:hypothetical protein
MTQMHTLMVTKEFEPVILIFDRVYGLVRETWTSGLLFIFVFLLIGLRLGAVNGKVGEWSLGRFGFGLVGERVFMGELE